MTIRRLHRVGLILVAACWLLAAPASAEITASGNVTASGNISAAPKIIYFQDGFETNDFTAWTGTFQSGTPAQDLPDVQSSVKRSGTYAAHAHYNNPSNAYSGTVDTSGTSVTWISGNTFGLGWDNDGGALIVINSVTYTVSSVTDTTHLVLTTSAGTQSGVSYTCSGNARQDANIHSYVHFDTGQGYPNGLEEVYVRMYVRYHLNAGGTDAGTGNTLQRKIMYFKDVATEGGSVVNFVVTSFANKFSLSAAAAGACNADGHAFNYGWDPPYLMTPPDRGWDTWYSVEVYLKLNTPGVSDGKIAFWVDGVQSLDYQSYNPRGTCTGGYKRFQFGVQADRSFTDPIDEERYWDDVVISNSYIGP